MMVHFKVNVLFSLFYLIHGKFEFIVLLHHHKYWISFCRTSAIWRSSCTSLNLFTESQLKKIHVFPNISGKTPIHAVLYHLYVQTWQVSREIFITLFNSSLKCENKCKDFSQMTHMHRVILPSNSILINYYLGLLQYHNVWPKLWLLVWVPLFTRTHFFSLSTTDCHTISNHLLVCFRHAECDIG